MKKYIIFILCTVLFVSCHSQNKPTEEPTKVPIDECDFTPTATIDGHAYVDLGLSVMWATCNLGATSIEDIGEYYAWQETTPWTTLTYMNYKIRFNPCNLDNILSSKYDAARVNWGKNWRIPTYDEQKELCDNCIWTWVDNFQEKGISGCIIKSKSSNKAIFIPTTGYMAHDTGKFQNDNKGYYWSSYAGPGNLWKGVISVINLWFYNGINYKYGGTWGTQHRADGLPIRAVVGKQVEYIPEGPYPIDEQATSMQGYTVSGKKDGYTYVDLGLPSRTLWATYNVGASKPTEYGNYYAWGETKTKSFYWDTTYVFYTGRNGHFMEYSKYTWSTTHHRNIDGKLLLEPEDDAATQNMSRSWCTPTRAQLEELCLYVQWSKKGNDGWVGTSKINGYTIYLPNAGIEYRQVPNNHFNAWYWSSEIMEPTADGTDYHAYALLDENAILAVHDCSRVQGLPVRAVVKQ